MIKFNNKTTNKYFKSLDWEEQDTLQDQIVTCINEKVFEWVDVEAWTVDQLEGFHKNFN